MSWNQIWQWQDNGSYILIIKIFRFFYHGWIWSYIPMSSSLSWQIEYHMLHFNLAVPGLDSSLQSRYRINRMLVTPPETHALYNYFQPKGWERNSKLQSMPINLWKKRRLKRAWRKVSSCFPACSAFYDIMSLLIKQKIFLLKFLGLL